MRNALRATSGAYHATRRAITSLLMVAAGAAYVAVGGMVLRVCWPQFNLQHAAFWWRFGDESAGAWLIVIIGGGVFWGFHHRAPRPFRGLLAAGVLGATLYYAPRNFDHMTEWLEPIAVLAAYLVVLGMMNVFETLPSGVGERHALKKVAAQTTLGAAGDATQAQALAALRGKRSRGSADDQEF